MAVLYVVATPIGNLEDITARALRVLREASLVACEDTRHTRALLTHFSIKSRLISCRQANEEAAARQVIAVLDAGESVAYASDAGSPALSDPGALLARRVAEAGHDIVPVPGPSAFAALVSVAGGRDKTVTFEGFLSPKAGRRRSRLAELLARGEAFVVYESPFRALKLLADLADLDSTRYVCVAREMTKAHEEFVRGSAAEVFARFEGSEARGEFSVYVSGRDVGEKSEKFGALCR